MLSFCRADVRPRGRSRGSNVMANAGRARGHAAQSSEAGFPTAKVLGRVDSPLGTRQDQCKVPILLGKLCCPRRAWPPATQQGKLQKPRKAGVSPLRRPLLALPGPPAYPGGCSPGSTLGAGSCEPPQWPGGPSLCL